MPVKFRKLETLSTDDLWKIHEDAASILAARFEAQKRELEKKLAELGVKFGGSPKDVPKPRPYPKVLPKFRNPERASETWSGRGKQPRWVCELLAGGASLDDVRIQ
jgi:DNA-binding protein H-NS